MPRGEEEGGTRVEEEEVESVEGSAAVSSTVIGAVSVGAVVLVRGALPPVVLPRGVLLDVG